MRVLVLFGAVLLAGGAFAQPMEEVVVEGRSLVAKGRDVASVSVVDREELDLLRPSHVSEALSRLPGVWISRGSGHEHLTAIRSAVLTGAGACGEFLFLEDGVPIRPTGFCNVNNLFELNSEQARALEVWRGPSSAVLGGNALRGAINVQTARPEATRIGLEGGPYGYAQARIETGGSLGTYDVGVSAHSTRSNGYRDRTGFEQHKATGVMEGELAGWNVRAVLSGSVLHQETGGFVRGFEAYDDSRLRDSNPNPEAYRDAWSSRLSVQLTRDAWTITPYARRSQMRFIQHFLPGQPIEANSQSSIGALVERRFSWEQMTLKLGGQLEAFSGALKQDQTNPTIGSAFLMATRPSGLHYDYEVDGHSAAFFYDLSYALSDTWQLLHSARLEQLSYDYDNQHINGNTRDDGTTCGFGGCLYTRPADRDDDFSDVAGRLGVAWTPGGGDLSAYLTVGTGFRPPQATEMYRLQNGQLIADLESERLVSFELGLKMPYLEVALFSERTRDFIFRDSEGFNVSNGRTKSEGVEVALDLERGAHSLALGFTWARHRYDFSGRVSGGEVITKDNDVDTAPRLLGNLRWQHRVSERLRHEFELVYMDNYYTNAANTQEYDGHAVVNWRAQWQASSNFSVHARLMNLLDRRYADRADFAFGSHRYFPAMPRQLYVGIDYTF